MDLSAWESYDCLRGGYRGVALDTGGERNPFEFTHDRVDARGRMKILTSDNLPGRKPRAKQIRALSLCAQLSNLNDWISNYAMPRAEDTDEDQLEDFRRDFR